jgi:hypothetical protein
VRIGVMLPQWHHWQHELRKEARMPALGISLILIAAGAILTFAVTATTSAVAVPTVGVILMIVGAVGLVFALLFMMSFSPWGRTTSNTTDEYVVHDDLHTHGHLR